MIPQNAQKIADGWSWFTHAERIERERPSDIVPVTEIPDAIIHAICAPRASVAELNFDEPRLMGVLNTTPDSFSDGGKFDTFDIALQHAHQMQANGADIIDIGGESTRPGAAEVTVTEEIARTIPIIQALRAKSRIPISIDTRKSTVAHAAVDAGVNLINDVSAMSFDPTIAATAAHANAPICLMHAQGDPETMQDNPVYDDVLLDVYDFLSNRIAIAENAGIARTQIIVDPGIGFGKTLDHNLKLLRGLSLFHGLGCLILLGASRKRFIGTIADVPDAHDRMPGTLAVSLHAIAQGVQLHRVHDIKPIKQAFALSKAILEGPP